MLKLSYAPIRRLQRVQILQWLVRRWQIEVTFQEVRAHLGVETQRQWSDARNRSDYTSLALGVVTGDSGGTPFTGFTELLAPTDRLVC